MSDPYAAPPEVPPAPSRLGCGLALVALFLVGFVGVGAVLLLRAPDDPASGSGLGAMLRTPPGYVQIDDARSGGGRLPAARAATLLGRDDVPGFQDGVLRAWGRRPGEEPRAVVVLLVEVETGGQASALRRDYVERARRAGATTFPAPDGFDGLHDVPDSAGRTPQRVVFTRGVRLFVVSVVTPARDRDTTEVVRLAEEQAVAR